jgi:predicted transcriptional regulator
MSPKKLFSTLLVNYGKMTLRYRSRTEIISQILEAANGHVDITKTRLMYKVFLSQTQVKEYAKVLTENELLRYDSVTRTFKTTQKGLKFLNLYNKIDELVVEKEVKEEQVWAQEERQSTTRNTRYASKT